MKTRTVSYALCGVVAGLLVGMAAFGVGNPDAVNASALAYREVMNKQVLPRADALRRPQATTQKKDDFSTSVAATRSSSSAAEEPAVDSAECTLARAMAAAFDASVEANVPPNFSNLAKRDSLKAVGVSFVSQYCPTATAHPAAPAQAASAARVDNHCSQYGERTTRRVTCGTEQAAGRVYPK